jgi:hypothetical protein
LQRLFARHVAFVLLQIAHRIGQIPRENLPQPCRLLADCPSAKLGTVAVSLQRRLLHDI